MIPLFRDSDSDVEELADYTGLGCMGVFVAIVTFLILETICG